MESVIWLDYLGKMRVEQSQMGGYMAGSAARAAQTEEKIRKVPNYRTRIALRQLRDELLFAVRQQQSHYDKAIADWYLWSQKLGDDVKSYETKVEDSIRRATIKSEDDYMEMWYMKTSCAMLICEEIYKIDHDEKIVYVEGRHLNLDALERTLIAYEVPNEGGVKYGLFYGYRWCLDGEVKEFYEPLNSSV